MSERVRFPLLGHGGLGTTGGGGEPELRTEPLCQVVNHIIGHDPILSDRTNIARADLSEATLYDFRDKPRMTPGKKIRAARKAAGLTQADLASRLGVPQSVISDWENEKLKSFADYAEPIHRALKLPLDVLLHSAAHSPVRGIEVVGEVQAGVWRTAVELPQEDRTMLPVVGVAGYDGAKLSGLKVAGPSMDLLYPDGSYVIVVSAEDTDVRHGDRVVVYRAKGELTEASLKEVRVEPDGRVGLWPRSSSPDYQKPIYLDAGDQDGPEIAYVVVGRFSMEDRPPPAIQYRKRAR